MAVQIAARQLQVVKEFDHHPRLFRGAVTKLSGFIAVAIARQIDKHDPPPAQRGIGSHSRIIVRGGAPQTVDKHDRVTTAGQIEPAHGGAGQRGEETVHREAPVNENCIFIQSLLTNADAYFISE